ncbi:MAG: hypothetical protein U0325_30895 [Polyangiales bacterium]
MDALTRALVPLWLAACAPVLDDDSARVSAPRLLAARAEPAEVRPGETVRVTALVAGPSGAVPPPPSWSLCLTRPSLASSSPVSEACRGDEPTAARPLGAGVFAAFTVPDDACARFGPDPPVGQGTALRPADPDSTGGYALPLRVRLPDADGFATVRLRCNLSGVTREVSADFNARARPTQNPAIRAVSRVRGADEEPLADAVTVRPGERLALRVAWPACDVAPCEGAEPYLRLDPVDRALTTARESLRVSWYGTAGRFDAPRTGRAGDDAVTSADNAWTAPATPGPVTLWVVLRDDRGGAAWRTFTADVR